mmetsp:Transcript_2173/g.3550  ORF Transcript_2173/g.3550 Transcript_2173/m.3550 type:complete len:296 (-) Transcript_2173:1766-2653(-)
MCTVWTTLTALQWRRRPSSTSCVRRPLRSTRSSTARWRPSVCCWSTWASQGSHVPSISPARWMRPLSTASWVMLSSRPTRLETLLQAISRLAIHPTTQQLWRRPRVPKCTMTSSSSCSWCARRPRTARSTPSWCTPTPRPRRWAPWKSSLLGHTRPICRLAVTGCSRRRCTRLHVCSSHISPTGAVWPPHLSSWDVTNWQWTLHAKPTAPSAGRRCSLPAWTPRSSGSHSWLACPSLSTLMTSTRCQSTTSGVGTLRSCSHFWRTASGWSGPTWASSQSWVHCMPGTALRSCWST